MLYILLTIALVIIALLSFYALKLIKQLKTQSQQINLARTKRINFLKESIEIIAKAMQKGDCNHSEGVIRLAGLLQPLGKDLTPFPAMFELYQTVRNMPTHEARRSLVKKERMKLDLERESTEAKLESQINQELHQLLADAKNFGES